jgi:hypothetical protein
VLRKAASLMLKSPKDAVCVWADIFIEINSSYPTDIVVVLAWPVRLNPADEKILLQSNHVSGNRLRCGQDGAGGRAMTVAAQSGP